MPVLAGSDISKSSDDRTRTYCAVINAYTHGALAATLFKAEDELRETSQYSGTFLVSHINGGVAGIAKTKAIDTIESGPILGIHGSAYLAKIVRLEGCGRDGHRRHHRKNQRAAEWRADLSQALRFLRDSRREFRFPYLRSIALGGGSVVKPAGARKSRVATRPRKHGLVSRPGVLRTRRRSAPRSPTRSSPPG